MDFILLALFGIIGGIFGGMGMGGGTVLIPLLTIFLSVEQKVAQGLNLFSFLIMALVAIIIYIKNKMIKLKNIIVIVISGTAFCVLGALLTNLVESVILKYVFASFLILISLYEFISCFKKNSPKP